MACLGPATMFIFLLAGGLSSSALDFANELDVHTGSYGAEHSSVSRNVSLICTQERINVRNLSVYISQYGVNNFDCVCKGKSHPCKTIQYAYDQTMLWLSNSTRTVKFVFLDGVYNMTESAIVDKQGLLLHSLEFTSLLGTTFKATNENAMFWIGCNKTDEKSCLSHTVKFSNLSFTNFGSKFPAAIVVFSINQLVIHNCSFAHNNCSAINSFETSATMIDVNFLDNKGTANFLGSVSHSSFPMSNVSVGGALGFIFKTGQNKFVNIFNSNFSGNKAATNMANPYVQHSLKGSQFPRVGGGILVLFMENSSYMTVNISQSHFVNNRAYSAGAVAILSESYSLSNRIVFRNCLFLKNVVNSTAGAILFANWDFTEGNSLIITNCTFKYNVAKYAGAIKYLINFIKHKDTGTPLKPGLEIINSHLCSNVAEMASAMHLTTDTSIFRQSMSPVHIYDSVFCQHDHTGEIDGRQNASQYGGTILTHKVDIKFMGNNSVTENKVGCGLYASNANVHVDGTILFSKNIAASSGAGMSLADTSHLILYPGSHIKFEENHSSTKGGALAVISVGMPEMTYVYNPFCFLQYSVPNEPHSRWDVKVEFIRNSAQLKGAAIFISTMTACLWTESLPHRSFEKAFRWTKNFLYRDNFVNAMYHNVLSGENSENTTFRQVDIATDTFRLELGDPKEVTLAPGEKIFFNLTGYDELNSSTYSVPIANSLTKLKDGKSVPNYLDLPNKYFVLDPYRKIKLIPLYYEVDSSYYKGITNRSKQYEIQFFDTYSSFIAKATLNVTPVLCRPGFVYDGKGSCVCDQRSYINSCYGTKVFLGDGLWAASHNGTLNAYTCPPNHCKCTKYMERTSCVYDSLHEDWQCSENRMGVLCGRCNGKENGLSLSTGECVKCDQESTIKAKGGLAILIISVLLAAVFIVYLNPSFSTKMRGPAFYLQMLPYLYTSKSPLGNFVRGISSFLTLGGSSGLPIPFCLGYNWDRLDIIALTYAFAAVILLVLLAVYILSRCFVLRFNRDSPFESFWILLIAIYCFFSETALIFFYCVDINGQSVFFYDGTVTCFVGRHLLMVTISSIILLFFVFLPPLAVALICTGRTNAPLQVVDALTKGLRIRYRWWWSVDLVRRFAYVAVFVFITKSGVKQVVFIVLSNFVLTAHTFCQPYKEAFANMSECFLLLSMTIITTLQLASTDGPAERVASGIVIANFIFIIFLFIYLLFGFIQRKYNLRFRNIFKRFENQKIPIPSRPQTPGRVDIAS